ncbi:tail fiber protein [Lonepinella sp. BR2271]|uniref:tail fiber protein n=1 Tax=Lonepinella sp. BR2271 TaxID=3434550 RepID=UPI003F6E4357
MKDLLTKIDSEDGLFHNGNPATGTVGTRVNDVWLNDVQASLRDVGGELNYLLSKANMRPVPSDTTQVYKAIKAVIGAERPLYSGVDNNDEGVVATAKAVKAAYDHATTGINNAATAQTTADGKVSKTGDTMTGSLTATSFIISSHSGAMLSASNSDVYLKNNTSGKFFQIKNDDWVAYENNPLLQQRKLSGENLNDLSDANKHVGFWGQSTNSNATLALNYPVTKAGSLMVLRSAYNVQQVYFPFDENVIYKRNLKSGYKTWSPWVNLIPTAATLNAITNDKKSSAVNSSSEDTVATSAAVKQAYDLANGKADKSDFSILHDLIVGIPFPYPLSTVPSGCLAMNGQKFNTSTYPILAKKYPNGVLPDLRGEFIRGWDNGRGVDSGRALLSSQGDAVRNITGAFKITDVYANDFCSGVFYGLSKPKSERVRTDENYHIDTLNAPLVDYPHAEKIGIDASRIVPTAEENRPRNIAFHYICLAA